MFNGELDQYEQYNEVTDVFIQCEQSYCINIAGCLFHVEFEESFSGF